MTHHYLEDIEEEETKATPVIRPWSNKFGLLRLEFGHRPIIRLKGNDFEVWFIKVIHKQLFFQS